MTLMWEVRAADGRLDELVRLVEELADPAALVYRSAGSDGSDARVVVIDPTERGLEVPGELVARPPHVWLFDAVPRTPRDRP